MTPEQRLALTAAALSAAGLLLIGLAAVAAGREHRREGS